MCVHQLDNKMLDIIDALLISPFCLIFHIQYSCLTAISICLSLSVSLSVFLPACLYVCLFACLLTCLHGFSQQTIPASCTFSSRVLFCRYFVGLFGLVMDPSQRLQRRQYNAKTEKRMHTFTLKGFRNCVPRFEVLEYNTRLRTQFTLIGQI